MTPVVAVIAPGMMGAAVGKRLVDNGAQSAHLAHGPQRGDGRRGRKPPAWRLRATRKSRRAISFCRSCRRAMRSACRALPPALKASNAKPVYVDCNAINPKTVDRVAAVDRADRLSVRRFRHHRLAAEAGRCRAAVLRLRSGGAALCHASPIRSRRPRAGWRDERRLGAENVLRRHHQGHAGDRRGDDAGGDPRRLRRRAVRGAAARARRTCSPGSSAAWR